MVRNHRNQPQAILFFSNNNIKRGGLNRCPYNPPWPLAPQPFCTLFDCCVVVVCDQAAWLHLAIWSQNCCALNPSQPKKWTNSPHITDCHVFRDCDRADCSIKTARSKNEGNPTTPPPKEYCWFSHLNNKSVCAFPRPSKPTIRRTLVYCHVFD